MTRSAPLAAWVPVTISVSNADQKMERFARKSVRISGWATDVSPTAMHLVATCTKHLLTLVACVTRSAWVAVMDR